MFYFLSGCCEGGGAQASTHDRIRSNRLNLELLGLIRGLIGIEPMTFRPQAING
jgi:hypothetical protein